MNIMNSTNLEVVDHKLRLLVVIASYGYKNLELLKRIIREYQNMSMEVDIIVISEAHKELDRTVKVVVGLPSKNPWSLPFAHKSIFAENVDKYDLFAYSEDDMGVTEENIRAFLRVTPSLAPDEIAGFLRYEINDSGIWSLPDVHGRYHWKPESVNQRGDYTVAEFTNEHSAFYLLTQVQLEIAIDSGGFLRQPYEGRHDMLCAAATDPYTSCGFRKVICISEFEDFLIHHLSNRYAGEYGISLLAFNEQIQILFSILNGSHQASSLCDAESNMLHGEWSKLYYENPSDVLLESIPENAKTILSIGCGSGIMESKLLARGAAITALPMDSVIGAVASRLGIDVIYGTLDECFKKLEGQTFDCVVMSNLLHLIPNPIQVLEHCSQYVRQNGVFVVGGPNFGSVKVIAKCLLNIEDYSKLRKSEESKIVTIGVPVIKACLTESGFKIKSLQWIKDSKKIGTNLYGGLLANDWVLLAER